MALPESKPMDIDNLTKSRRLKLFKKYKDQADQAMIRAINISELNAKKYQKYKAKNKQQSNN